MTRTTPAKFAIALIAAWAANGGVAGQAVQSDVGFVSQRTTSTAAKTGSSSMKAGPSAPVAKKGSKKIKNPCIKTADGLVCPPEVPPPPKTPSGL